MEQFYTRTTEIGGRLARPEVRKPVDVVNEWLCLQEVMSYNDNKWMHAKLSFPKPNGSAWTLPLGSIPKRLIIRRINSGTNGVVIRLGWASPNLHNHEVCKSAISSLENLVAQRTIELSKLKPECVQIVSLDFPKEAYVTFMDDLEKCSSVLDPQMRLTEEQKDNMISAIEQGSTFTFPLELQLQIGILEGKLSPEDYTFSVEYEVYHKKD